MRKYKTAVFVDILLARIFRQYRGGWRRAELKTIAFAMEDQVRLYMDQPGPGYWRNMRASLRRWNIIPGNHWHIHPDSHSQ